MARNKPRRTLPLGRWTRTLRIALKNAREKRQAERRDAS